jgi:hypothetical protein
MFSQNGYEKAVLRLGIWAHEDVTLEMIGQETEIIRIDSENNFSYIDTSL